MLLKNHGNTPVKMKGELAIIFLGAGTSKTFGIPTMPDMARKFGQIPSSSEKSLFDLIVKKLENYRYFDIEALITVLERIVNINRFIEELNNPSLHYFLDNLAFSWQNTIKYIRGQADQENKVAENLLGNVKEFIRNTCAQEIEEEKFSIFDQFFGTILEKTETDFKSTLKKQAKRRHIWRFSRQITT